MPETLEQLIKFAKDHLVIAKTNHYLLALEIQQLEDFLESHGVEVEDKLLLSQEVQDTVSHTHHPLF